MGPQKQTFSKSNSSSTRSSPIRNLHSSLPPQKKQFMSSLSKPTLQSPNKSTSCSSFSSTKLPMMATNSSTVLPPAKPPTSGPGVTTSLINFTASDSSDDEEIQISNRK